MNNPKPLNSETQKLLPLLDFFGRFDPHETDTSISHFSLAHLAQNPPFVAPLVKKATLHRSSFWQALFLRSFGTLIFDLAEPIVNKGITTWQIAYEFFSVFEILRGSLVELSDNSKGIERQTCSLVKNILVARSFEDSKACIRIQDLRDDKKAFVLSLEDVFITKLTADPHHLVIYDHINRKILCYDLQTMQILIEFPFDGNVLAMKAHEGCLYIIFCERERYALQAVDIKLKGYVGQECALPLSEGNEWSPILPKNSEEPEVGSTHYYAFSHFRKGFAFIFFVPNNDSSQFYINVLELPTFSKNTFFLNRQELSSCKISYSKPLQLSISLECDLIIDSSYDDGLFYVAFTKNRRIKENLYINIYDNTTLLQTLDFSRLEFPLFWDKFFVANSFIYFLKDLNGDKPIIFIYDLNRQVFLNPLLNAIYFPNYSFPSKYFEFEPASLEFLLELFTRGSAKVDRSAFSPDIPIMVELPGNISFVEELPENEEMNVED